MVRSVVRNYSFETSIFVFLSVKKACIWQPQTSSCVLASRVFQVPRCFNFTSPVFFFFFAFEIKKKLAVFPCTMSQAVNSINETSAVVLNTRNSCLINISHPFSQSSSSTVLRKEKSHAKGLGTCPEILSKREFLG